MAASHALCLSHVWPRPSLLRCQRDKARLLDPAPSANAEYRTELERCAITKLLCAVESNTFTDFPAPVSGSSQPDKATFAK
jgi:hypothetical protein